MSNPVATTCATTFAEGRKLHKSSATPVANMMVAPNHNKPTLLQLPVKSTARVAAAKMAIPPISAVGVACQRSSVGYASQSIRWARRMTSGVSASAPTSAMLSAAARLPMVERSSSIREGMCNRCSTERRQESATKNYTSTGAAGCMEAITSVRISSRLWWGV